MLGFVDDAHTAFTQLAQNAKVPGSEPTLVSAAETCCVAALATLGACSAGSTCGLKRGSCIWAHPARSMVIVVLLFRDGTKRLRDP